MQTDNKDMFGIHAMALALRAYRTEVLSSNLANANTPNYKARDLDFNQVLADQWNQANTVNKVLVTGEEPVTDTTGSIPIQPDQLLYRTPVQTSLDGNTVDSQMENSKFLDNSLHYQASLTFLNSRIQSVLSAIRGQ